MGGGGGGGETQREILDIKFKLTCTLHSLSSEAPKEIVALRTHCWFASRPHFKLVDVGLCSPLITIEKGTCTTTNTNFVT